MEKVELQMKNGKIRSVAANQARVLVSIGRASYLTRDIVAVQPVEVVQIEDSPEEAEDKPKRKYTRRKKEESEE